MLSYIQLQYLWPSFIFRVAGRSWQLCIPFLLLSFLVLTYVRYWIKTVKIAKQSETINLYSGAFFNVISVYDILTFLHGYSI